MVANMILLFVFIHCFLFCIYIAEEHTRHVSMCFTVAVECVMPLYKDTCNDTHTHTQTHANTQTNKPGDKNRHTNAGNRVT